MKNAPTHGQMNFPAIWGQYFEHPARLPPGAPFLWLYTDRISYGPGEVVRVHVNSSVPGLRAALTHDGRIPETVRVWPDITGRAHDTPDQCSVTGCGWPVTFEFTIDAEWPSGGYRLMIFARENARLFAETIFLLRPAVGCGKGRILFIAPTSTWIAYNDWGGSNHYEGTTGSGRDQFSPVVSISRPLARGFVSLPPDAPRAALDFTPEPMAPPVYPHMEWALATGYSKKYASSGWASFDRPYVHWLERQGYAVDVASQTDLHQVAGLLDSYPCVTFSGHDEYWSWQMRDTVDAYVDAGGHVARFAGNFMWQIRLEDEGRTQVCYKYRARDEDPLFGTPDDHLTSTSWEARAVGRPGALTFGLNATRGIYAGWGGAVARGAHGFPLYRPDHWAFAGTGLGYGDVLGAAARVFGYEVDGLDYVIRDGLPFPAAGERVPEGLEILALGMVSNVEAGKNVRSHDVFLGSSDAAFIAETLYGEVTAETLDRSSRGSGMIVNFSRGKGEVFHAGSAEWVAGLIRRDACVEQVTKNVLNRYLGLPPPPAL